MPWWVYGPRGMQLWFPSALRAVEQEENRGGATGAPAAGPSDVELTFDKEVYPVGKLSGTVLDSIRVVLSL